MFDQEKKEEILLQYLLEELSPEAGKTVENWIEENAENRCYFEQFRKTHIHFRQTIQCEAIRGNYQNIHYRIFRRRTIRRWSRIAAIVILFLGVASGIYIMDRGPQPEILPVTANLIPPGSSKAILHLSSGETVNLGNREETILEQDGSAIAVRASGQLNYVTSPHKEKDSYLNRLEVPRGGEFRLTLADGTEVWLNAESELQYPVSFSGPERIVKLSGEAYFKVTKDTGHPFIVQTGELQVKVYGTQFNINTHHKGKIETVLVDGKVSLLSQKKGTLLKPNQKGEFLPATGQIAVTDVDVLPYIAWKEGNFMFHNETLENIMEKLGRWYDIDVFYAHPEVRNIRLSGILERYNEVNGLFHYFEKISDARFTVTGKTVNINVR